MYRTIAVRPIDCDADCGIYRGSPGQATNEVYCLFAKSWCGVGTILIADYLGVLTYSCSLLVPRAADLRFRDEPLRRGGNSCHIRRRAQSHMPSEVYIYVRKPWISQFGILLDLLVYWLSGTGLCS
jgi:hypothetical protein